MKQTFDSKNLLFPKKGMNISKWRRVLKEGLFDRDTHCRSCGRPMSSADMHEAIISRAQFMGMKKAIRVLFFNELNCVLLHHKCHLQDPPSRQQSWEEQYAIYGDILIDWYEYARTLFKSNLERFDG